MFDVFFVFERCFGGVLGKERGFGFGIWFCYSARGPKFDAMTVGIWGPKSRRRLDT